MNRPALISHFIGNAHYAPRDRIAFERLQDRGLHLLQLPVAVALLILLIIPSLLLLLQLLVYLRVHLLPKLEGLRCILL